MLIVLLCCAASAQAVAPVLDEVWVRIARPGERRRLGEHASDLDDHRAAPDGRAIVYADDAEQARLARAGFELEVVQEDLARFYAERAAADQASLGAGPGSMGGFRTLDEIDAFLDGLAAAHPELVSPRWTIGTSLEGRPIQAVRLSDDPTVDQPGEPLVFFDALHHAREAITAESLLAFAQFLVDSWPSDARVRRVLATRSLVFVPCVNPDGYEHNRLTNPNGGGLWRKNRRPNGDGSIGVDLNRNWGFEWGPQWPGGSSGTTSATDYRGTAPFSEPESAVLRDAALARGLAVWISAHAAASKWLVPYGYSFVLAPDDERLQAWASSFATGTDWDTGTPWQVLYPANGTTLDWGYATLGAFSFTPEIGDPVEGWWPPPSRIPELVALVREAYLDAAAWAGGWIEVREIDSTELAGDGDGWLEPGEELELALALDNVGLAPVSGSARFVAVPPELEVVVPSTFFEVGASTVLPAQLAGAAHTSPYTRATAVALPLRLRVADGAPDGPLDLELDLEWEGFATRVPARVFVGQRRRLALDDAESFVPGWSASSSPAAAAWAFERGVPEATASVGQELQPGQDHTQGFGTRCWVTGAAAGLFPTQNEVHGATTLVSPRFDARPFAHVELSFARWFADYNGPADDRLELWASNDDGQSWVQVEEASHAPAWSVRSLALEDHVALSDAMRLRFAVSDVPDDDLCEALIDDIELATRSALPTLFVWGRTAPGDQPFAQLDGPPVVSWRLFASSALSAGVVVPGVQGTSWLAAPTLVLASGTTDAAGRARLLVDPPAAERHLQVLFDEGGPAAAFSNPIELP